ncbi:MAG: gamma-glutamyl-gamma-aminobutyrate hydrolase family protein, partial [Patescibacteria group bacterium]|nr:gamma-glutamyl-gamma-aminobutyrate hydrolase family protein [Patescibacteria group bacterium]
MDILLIDNKTKHFEEIKTLAKSNGASVKIIKCKNIDLINPEDFDFIILSGGSRYSVMGNQKKYVKEIEMIKNTKTPIFGICLGFQLIIKAFEGTLETFNLGNRTQGIIEIKKKKQDDIFKNIQNFKVYESHRWRLKKMPKNFINLAESRDGVEIIKHKKKIIYGVQFHPEVFLNKTCGKQIFDNFMQIVCEKGHPLKREKGRPLRRRERSDQRKRSDLVKRFVFNFQRKNYFNFVKLFFILCFILLPNFVFANNALDIVINEIAWMG